jgi:hypothetical protein
MKKYFKVILSILLVITCLLSCIPALAKAQTPINLNSFSIVNIKNTNEGIKIKWEKCEEADYYSVYRKQDKNKYKFIDKTESLTYIDTTVKNGTKYSYIIRAYNDDNYLNCEKAKNLVYLITPAIDSIENIDDSSLSVKWTKNKKATSYQVVYSYYDDFSKYKTVASISDSKIIKKIANNKDVYIKMRSYVKIGKITYYSAWSKTINNKIYIMNTNTLKFHDSKCRYVKNIDQNNYSSHNSKKELIDWGYEPCKVCSP